MSTSGRRVLLALLVLAATGTGLWTLGRSWLRDPRTASQVHQDIWTCPMHPEIQEHGPGKCPTCGMDLVRASSPQRSSAVDDVPAAAGTARAPVQLDTRRRQLLGVRTARVEKAALTRSIRVVGIVRYDETRLSDVNLKLDGWARRLHVDATGQAVKRGQPLLEFYSPDLLATQNEYLLALSTQEALASSQVADAHMQAERLVASARQRLLLWDLPASAVTGLEQSRRADGTVTFVSPVNGYVIEKPVIEGMRVAAGQTLYRIADLSSVWVEADVFEADSPFVKTGATAVVTLDAWPGESWRGKAVFIYPFVEEKTRTLRVRFAFPNPALRLKPGMYANVELSSSVQPGLTIPADALLDTGVERLVFIAEGDGYFTPRNVEIGARVNGRVQIVGGLTEGEEVAAGASFFLDSESQLRAAAGLWERPPDDRREPAAPGATITFHTVPHPPRNGENEIEVRVTDASGRGVEDAQLRVVFHMAAMPSMNMPAMTSEATLSAVGGGIYRGKGIITMLGRWDVTVTATRAGARVGTLQTTVVAR